MQAALCSFDARGSLRFAAPPAVARAAPAPASTDDDACDRRVACAMARRGSATLDTEWRFWIDMWAPRKAAVGGVVHRFKEVGTVTCTKEFWGYFNSLLPRTRMHPGSSLHLFVGGVRPTWEDPSHRRGGRFKLACSTSHVCFKVWLDLCLAVLANHFPNPGKITGVSFTSVGPDAHSASLWVTEYDLEAKAFLETLAEGRRKGRRAMLGGAGHHALTWSSNETAHAQSRARGVVEECFAGDGGGGGGTGASHRRSHSAPVASAHGYAAAARRAEKISCDAEAAAAVPPPPPPPSRFVDRTRASVARARLHPGHRRRYTNTDKDNFLPSRPLAILTPSPPSSPGPPEGCVLGADGAPSPPSQPPPPTPTPPPLIRTCVSPPPRVVAAEKRPQPAPVSKSCDVVSLRRARPPALPRGKCGRGGGWNKRDGRWGKAAVQEGAAAARRGGAAGPAAAAAAAGAAAVVQPQPTGMPPAAAFVHLGTVYPEGLTRKQRRAILFAHSDVEDLQCPSGRTLPFSVEDGSVCSATVLRSMLFTCGSIEHRSLEHAIKATLEMHHFSRSSHRLSTPTSACVRAFRRSLVCGQRACSSWHNAAAFGSTTLPF